MMIKPDKEFLEITLLMLSDEPDKRHEGARQIFRYAAKMDYWPEDIRRLWKRTFRDVKGTTNASQIELFEEDL